MSKALDKTGRPILYTLCNWGDDEPYDWVYAISNSYRMSGDVYDSFTRPDSRCPCIETIGCQWPGFHCSVLNILNKMAAIQSRSQPGAFKDMDMLEVVNGGQDDNEYVTHSNPAVIALNQDPTATTAIRKWRFYVNDTDKYSIGEMALWTCVMKYGDIALIIAGNNTCTMNATLSDIFFDQSTAGTSVLTPQLGESWDVYDLWANRMSKDEAASVLNGTAPTITTNSTSLTRYNATAMSSVDGLAANVSALFGAKVGTIPPQGTWSAQIP
jgi:alpha-galactosidase